MNYNILVIGSANVEYVLKTKKPIIKGSKNFVEVEELFGGSGVNYTLRLLAYKERVFPLLFVGNDTTGEKIYNKVFEYKNSLEIDKSEFFIPSLITPRTTIIVEGLYRTILAQDMNEKNIFKKHIEKRLVKDLSANSVIIGHIHSDRSDINRYIGDLTTSYVINKFANKNSLIYINPGISQLEYGFEYWREHFKKVDILQLNIHELSKFIENGKNLSLYELISKIRELNISAIITLDQFGALGIYKSKNDALYLARAITSLDDFVDSTGAGDAFCAGMVSALAGDKYFSDVKFKEAMGKGRSWATFACRSYGGANNCPEKSEIDRFHDQNIKENEVMVYNNNAIKDILVLLDSMLDRD